jgi:hypothetical protein
MGEGKTQPARLKLADGREVVLQVPSPGNAAPSFFVLGLAKAGSTLFNRVMRPIATAAGFSFFSLRNTLSELGIPPDSVDYDASDPVFLPHGCCYGGFRGLPGGMAIPAFGKGRSVLLVRDPRDMLTSLYYSIAFSHRPPPSQEAGSLVDAFNDQRHAALESSVDAYALQYAPVVLRIFETMERKTAGIEPKCYRYEDVIFRKLDWIRDVLAYLDLAVPDRVVAAIVQRNDVLPAAENAGAHIRRVTPGDHREKLAAATIAQLDDILAPVLRRYGYDQPR